MMNSRNNDLPVPASKVVDPADANFSASWNETIREIGFTCVQVLWETGEKNGDLEGVFEAYGTILHKQRLGHLDSVEWVPQKRSFYYVHTARLKKALNFVNTFMHGAITIGLFSKVRIAWFDDELKSWRELLPENPTS